MTTNESMFFRDKRPFDNLVNFILPQLKANNPERKNIRIWSAACSSGQEPYSINMTLRNEKNHYPDYKFDIIATDISPQMIEQAKIGVYSQFEVQRGLTIHKLLTYFQKQSDDMWKINADMKENISFKVENLLDDYKKLGKFDIIFCRNILIYFDKERKIDILNRLSESLNKGGFLVLGSSETCFGLCDKFKMSNKYNGVHLLV